MEVVKVDEQQRRSLSAAYLVMMKVTFELLFYNY